MSIIPLRIMWNANPMAWAAEAQADAVAKHGPRRQNSIDT
jgi:hypothetical protein